MGRPRRWKNKKNTEKGEAHHKQGSYDIIVKKNEHFEKYYKQLNLMPEEEFEDFLNVLRQPLPLTFRITSYKSYASETLRILKEKHFKYIDEITTENKEEVLEASANKGASLIRNNLGKEGSSSIYKCLSWHPNELAWQVNLSRQDVRKNKHFDEFKQFLINQTENGNLNRQEAVSMIPPLILDVKPEHLVLDMCAAPGSKTAQLIEFLHQDRNNPIPQGLVVANDLENKRCYLLMHQLKRLESPNFMIINHDSSSLPNFRIDLNENLNKNVMYDRILADVPCSGDGTFRKNVDVWTKWNFSHTCNLHGIQFRIAKRAVELLKPGGLMVYSTCSLNPVENEAVVYNLLLKFKGEIELVEARDKLPGLKTLNGLLKWNVMGKKGEIFDNIQQVGKYPQYEHLLRNYMFPPEESVARELNLDRCIRVLPHHQDTGGFFITLIRKLPIVKQVDLDVNYLNEQKEETQSTVVVDSFNPPEADTSRVMKAPPAKKLKHVFEENPFKFMDSDSQLLQEDWPKVKEFFGIRDDFPIDQLLTRNKKGENIKNVYFVSKQIRQLTESNGDRIKFINMGVPIFSRAEIKGQNACELRVLQEGIDIVINYFTKRLVRLKERSDLIKILSESMPSIEELSQDVQDQIKLQCNGLYGSFILTTKSETPTPGLADELSISFIAWLGKSTIRPLINVPTRSFFLTILSVDKAIIDQMTSKIKEEDRINSEKSLKTNLHYQARLKEQEEKNKQSLLDEKDNQDLIEQFKSDDVDDDDDDADEEGQTDEQENSPEEEPMNE
ncbi:unnamed protein product [Brachionus calyciflorus]|uniref:tRNA (cytosine(34)-C(5))-methyltransferase n=1 Tax=Brachionus calyciflorus TaxID=104777 RepID=A0A813M8C9_9BILA|nr:unnamed protein product [Brachionus calyciflorus]